MVLKEGDKVQIRSRDWFFSSDNLINCNVGIFIKNMSIYCGMEATIVKVIQEEEINGELSLIRYLLDIDNGNWYWSEFMFEDYSVIYNMLSEYCRLSCPITVDSCIKYCPIFSNIGKLSIGDTIVIKSIKWFNNSKDNRDNVGMFTKKMSEYCNKTAKIVDIKYSKSGDNLYSLDIDDGFFSWKDYMFDNYFFVKDKLKKFCDLGCISKDCDNCSFNTRLKISL